MLQGAPSLYAPGMPPAAGFDSAAWARWPLKMDIKETKLELEVQQLEQYCQEEFQKIASMSERSLARETEWLHAAPVRPRDGMLRGADGTDWNPGGGQGLYLYYNATWNRLIEIANTATIADGAVTTSKLADSAVTTLKISGLSVTEEKLANLAVTLGKVASLAINESKIVDAAVTAVKIATNAITTDKLVDGSVLTAKLADLAVSLAKLGTGAVDTSKLIDAAVTAIKIADGSITIAKHATALRPVEILGALGAAGTQGRTVFLTTDNKLYRDTGAAWTAVVPTTDLTGQITETQVTDLAISTPKLAANAVTAAKIAAGTITTNEIAADTIVAGNIAAGAISTSELAANAVVASKLSIQEHATNSLAFTSNSPSAGRVAWTAFTLQWSGNTYSISSGDSALEMLWFDKSLSTTALSPSSRATFEANFNPADGDILLAVNNSGTYELIQHSTAIAGGAIKTSAIISDKIAASAVQTTHLAAGAVTAAKIAAGTITTNEIAAGTILAGNISANTITGNEIAANAIGAVAIAAGAVVTDKLAANSVTAAKIAALTITAAEIAATTITGAKIAANTIQAGKLDILTHTVTGLTFTNNSPSAGRVAWSAHTIQWGANTYSISASDTNLEMMWLDRSVSTTALQATSRATFETDFSVNDGDILLAVNSGGTHEVVYHGTFITAAHIKTSAVTTDKLAANSVTAAKIAALTITAAEIAANTITAAKMSVTTLSAIAADLGAVTAGTVTLDSSGHIKSGQTAYNTGVGLFLGKDGATTKLSLGDPSGNYLRWTGTLLESSGEIKDTRSYAAGSIPIASSLLEVTRSNDSAYTKIKEIYLARGGTVSTSFEMRSNGSSTAYGKIYKNGVAAGTERTEALGSWTTFTENISVSAGDLIQLYVKIVSVVNSCFWKNFIIKNSFYIAETTTLDTP